MWQLESAATNASSGSTASAREYGSRTDSGEDEAGTVMPPSNDHVWPRLYLMSAERSAPRFHDTRGLVFMGHRATAPAQPISFTNAS